MDMKQIKSLVQEFDASSLSKLKITQESFSIELEKTIGVVAAPVAVAPVAVAAPAPLQLHSKPSRRRPCVDLSLEPRRKRTKGVSEFTST